MEKIYWRVWYADYDSYDTDSIWADEQLAKARAEFLNTSKKLTGYEAEPVRFLDSPEDVQAGPTTLHSPP